MGSVFPANLLSNAIIFLLKSISIIVLYSVVVLVCKDSKTSCNTHPLLHITTDSVVRKHFTDFDVKSNL